MNQKTILIASILALVLALVILVRMSIVKHSFDTTVRVSLKTSEGYDEKFITMVDRLENILATRASFGYTGGKDPMTGSRRQVVQSAPSSAPAPKASAPAVTAPPPSDLMKLTAIIGDANERHLMAIIMNGERSYSVNAGDVVAGRRITKITNEGIFMESGTQSFYYDIYGKRQTRNKTGGQSSERNPNH